MVLNSFFPRLQVGRRNQIQQLRFEKHFIKQYLFYLCALVPQHQKMLDFSVEIKFVDFKFVASPRCAGLPSGIQREMEELCQGAAGGISYLWGWGDRPTAFVLIRSALSEVGQIFEAYLIHGAPNIISWETSFTKTRFKVPRRSFLALRPTLCFQRKSPAVVVQCPVVTVTKCASQS